MKRSTLIFLCFISAINYSDGIKECIIRSSVYCVCNATYCDELEPIERLSKGNFVGYTSSKDGMRFSKYEGRMRPMKQYKWNLDHFWPYFASPSLKIHRKKRFQKVFGFGIAFTDASGYNMMQLSEGARDNIIKSYFHKNGLEMNMGRVPIGGTDNSLRQYAYNMYPEDDVHLTNFTLTPEDYEFKIPFIRQAHDMATSQVYLVAGVWSPPIWMKSNNDYQGQSHLKVKYYQTYADYHVRFLEEYEKNNFTFWGISTGNEPSVGLMSVALQTLGWSPHDLGRWIEKNFGPTLRNSSFANIKILMADEMRIVIPQLIEMAKETSNCMDFIDGIATHTYYDFITSHTLLDDIRNMNPGKFLLSTETTIRFDANLSPDAVWDQAHDYFSDMVQYFNHWITGWIDWNMALDPIEGGPNLYNNRLQAPIMAPMGNDEFFKRPHFYSIGHFSKFVPRGSKRIYVETMSGHTENVAFLRPDGGVSVLFHNPDDFDRRITIMENGKGFIELNLPKKSIHSLVYW